MKQTVATGPEGLAKISRKLVFTKKLQAVPNKTHATRHVDEVMPEISADVYTLFEPNYCGPICKRPKPGWRISYISTASPISGKIPRRAMGWRIRVPHKMSENK